MFYFLVVYSSGNLLELPKQTQGSLKAQFAIIMVIFGFLAVGSSGVSGGVATDRQSGLYFKLLSTPLRPWQELCGRTIGWVIFGTFLSAVLFSVALITGATFVVNSWTVLPLVFLIVVFVDVFSSGIGLIIGSFAKTGQSAFSLSNALVVIIAFSTGLLVPTTNLPAWFQASANFPSTVAMDILTSLLVEGRTTVHMQTLLYVGLSSVVTFLTGTYIYTLVVLRKGAEYR